MTIGNKTMDLTLDKSLTPFGNFALVLILLVAIAVLLAVLMEVRMHHRNNHSKDRLIVRALRWWYTVKAEALETLKKDN